MLGLVVHWAVVALALVVAAWIVPGVYVGSWVALGIAALVLGIVNTLVRPVLVLLSLPLTILTLGLFYLVVNGLCFMLAAAIVPGFRVEGCGAAILGAFVTGLIGWIVGAMIGPRTDR